MHYRKWRPSAALLLAALLAASTATETSAQQARLTTPQQHFGHEIGADYVLPNYTKFTEFVKKLDTESDRMIVQSIGKTAEGRARVAEGDEEAARALGAIADRQSVPALLELLPSETASVKDAALQDQVFVANLGIVLEHGDFSNTVIVSNFTSEPRRGESQVGLEFFGSMGLDAAQK